MSQTKITSHQPETDVRPVDTAAIYARVSSFGQLGRDGDEDGYSLPAQVEACKREAITRAAVVAKVYMERAESAKSDDRPILREMMRELRTLGVKYLIVHKVDRLARNRRDDANLYEELVGMGITLVSVSENIDETPGGRLMHGVLATIAEYYSNNLATEVKKGLRRKHEQGGTPHRPPIGYRSKREWIAGQDIRTVEIDPERAPLVKLAFNLYATGKWTTRKLAAYLAEQGLRSRPTRRFPERPLSASRIQDMLRNSYYIGIVTWNGRRYPGKHDKMIDQETFDQVQALLAAARQGGDRAQLHQHYLRGSILCDKCFGRLLYGRHRSRSGQHYEYFSCNNRAVRGRPHQCDSGHYAVDTTEENIIETVYTEARIAPEIQEQIRRELREELTDRAGIIEQEAERHEQTLKKIEAKQEKLVQLFYKDLVSEDVFAAEQDKLKTERRAAERLRSTAAAQIEDVQATLDLALSRVENPYEFYRDATPLERRILNQAIFERIEVGPEGEVTGTVLTPTYEALSAWRPGLGRPRTTGHKTQDQDRPRSPYVRLRPGLSHHLDEGRTSLAVRLSSALVHRSRFAAGSWTASFTVVEPPPRASDVQQ